MVTHMCIYALEVGDLSAIMPFLFWSSFYMFGVLIVSIIHHMVQLNNNYWERTRHVDYMIY